MVCLHTPIPLPSPITASHKSWASCSVCYFIHISDKNLRLHQQAIFKIHANVWLIFSMMSQSSHQLVCTALISHRKPNNEKSQTVAFFNCEGLITTVHNNTRLETCLSQSNSRGCCSVLSLVCDSPGSAWFQGGAVRCLKHRKAGRGGL